MDFSGTGTRVVTDRQIALPGSVAAIGAFDGVHRGHQRIIAHAAAGAAAGPGLPLVVITFDPHPAEVIRPGSHPDLLCTAARRAELLAGLGVDAVCMMPFTLEFSRLDPEEFVRLVLVDRLHANALGHERIAAALACTLGLPDADEGWAAPLPAPLRRPPHEVARAEVAWVRTHFAPWVGRRLRGATSGDDLVPKRPEPLPVLRTVV